MDPLDFLDGEKPSESAAAQPAETPAPEPAATETPTAEGPARGPDGKFVSKAPADAAPAAESPPQAPATPPEAVQTPPDTAKPPEGYVPLAALQAVREELNSFKRQIQQQPPQPAPDPYEDFEAYQQWQSGQVAQERADWSRQLAEARHGQELVQQAQQWAFERFDTDPVFAQAAQSSRDPYGFAIAEYQRHQALSLLSDPANFAKFQAFLSGQAPQATAPPAPAAPQPQPAAPPPSITSAPSAGGVQHVPLGQDEVYRAAFG